MRICFRPFNCRPWTETSTTVTTHSVELLLQTKWSWNRATTSVTASAIDSLQATVNTNWINAKLSRYTSVKYATTYPNFYLIFWHTDYMTCFPQHCQYLSTYFCINARLHFILRVVWNNACGRQIDSFLLFIIIIICDSKWENLYKYITIYIIATN